MYPVAPVLPVRPIRPLCPVEPVGPGLPVRPVVKEVRFNDTIPNLIIPSTTNLSIYTGDKAATFRRNGVEEARFSHYCTPWYMNPVLSLMLFGSLK